MTLQEVIAENMREFDEKYSRIFGHCCLSETEEKDAREFMISSHHKVIENIIEWVQNNDEYHNSLTCTEEGAYFVPYKELIDYLKSSK